MGEDLEISYEKQEILFWICSKLLPSHCNLSYTENECIPDK